MKCLQECRETTLSCANKECRHWIDYDRDYNCSIHAAEVHGPMTLDQVSKRMGMTLVRVKQIEDSALNKLKKRNSSLIKELLHE
jgi:hypothetical protein